MTELLSYHSDHLLPGRMVSRKRRVRPAVMWFGQSYGGTSDSHRGKSRTITLKVSSFKKKCHFLLIWAAGAPEEDFQNSIR